MKSHKQAWIAALCLLSAIAIAVAFTAHTTKVQTAKHVAPKSPASLAQPAVYLAGSSLRGAMLADGGASGVSGNLQANPIFPPVEQFTLTPPNPDRGVGETTLNVRFAGAGAAQLPSQITIKLANQEVTLHRSTLDPNSFYTQLDFDWERFVREQEQRKEAASKGRMVPIFDGRHYVGVERMQFIEPAQIEAAMQSHQPIQFSPGPLSGSIMNVFPDHQLMMTNTAVVEDSAQTFDACRSNPGNPNGAWTFNTLMLAIAGATPADPLPAEQMLLGMLNSWNNPNLFVNNGAFQVLPRPPSPAQPNMGHLNFPAGSGTGLLGNWPVDGNNTSSCTDLNGNATACPSLSNAPVRLDAIVNRIDLGANGIPFSPAGELRFVFTVTIDLLSQGQGLCTNTGMDEVMNIILEYRVGANLFPSALSWAQVWNALPDLNSGQTFSPSYLTQLQQTITDPIVAAGACRDSHNNPISCISQVRTNEVLLASPVWELREFHFSNTGGVPLLSEGTVAQTPDSSFNTEGNPLCGSVNHMLCAPMGDLGSYISSVDTQLIFQQTQGAQPQVPDDITVNNLNVPFLGGSAFNPGGAFWKDTGILNNPNDVSRIDFSLNTCNACHGGETNTHFQQVFNRQPGQPSALSNFLLGSPQCLIQTENLGESPTQNCKESVTDPDPANNTIHTLFGDIARRVLNIQNVCGDSNCDGGTGNDLLLPFTNKPIGVH